MQTMNNWSETIYWNKLKVSAHFNNFYVSVCWKLYSGISKTLATGKTSSFAASKYLGEVEVGINCFVRKRNEKKGTESYFEDDLSSIWATLGLKDDPSAASRRPPLQQYGPNKFSSMPALMHIKWLEAVIIIPWTWRLIEVHNQWTLCQLL